MAPVPSWTMEAFCSIVSGGAGFGGPRAIWADYIPGNSGRERGRKWLKELSNGSTPRRATDLSPRPMAEDLFVHFSEIKMDGYKTLDEGQRVSFEVTTGQNGKLQASDVHKL